MKKKRVVKKNYREVHAYKKSIKNDDQPLDGTIELNNTNLIGSEEVHESVISGLNASEDEISIFVKIKRYIRKHTFDTIISFILAVVVALVGWYGKTMIDIKIECAVFENQLVAIEKRIDSLEDNSVTKELLNLQVEAIRKDLENYRLHNSSDLNRRIELIEKEIEIIGK